MALANKNAHIFQINVLRNGVPETLTGAGCSATFVRADDVSVPLDGEIEGNTASVTLTDACYRVPGKFKLTINLSTAEITSAIFIGDGSVMLTSTDTVVDEEEIIPSIEDIIAQQQAAVAATNAANQAASTANAAASAANTAAGKANSAANSADTAASSANTQATNASQKAQQAEQAATDASAAANTANEKAQIAATKAALAEDAAERANQAETTANAAAKAANDAISGVSASATTLSAGSPATASASFVSGSWEIAFGIPQGAKGDPGDGDVSTVDNISPLNGNVQLNALAMQGNCNNANNALTIGIYDCSPTTTNIPVAQWGTIFNISNAFTFDHQNSYIFQFFYPINGGPTWKRSILNTGQWTAWTLVALEAYPVGSIYMSANSASPASIFGGTWTQLKDRFLLGLGDGGAPAGTTGGAATVTLTEAQLPSHAHASIAAGYQVLAANNQNSDFMVGSGSVIGISYTGNYTTSNTGENQAHENMPPYYAVYIWQRTA